MGTLQLEFRALSRHTGNPAYEAVAQRIMTYLRRLQHGVPSSSTPEGGAWPSDLPRGLYPMFISPETGQWMSQEVTLGARADSLYEYLLKQWILSGRTDQRMRQMYDTSVEAIHARLVRRGGPDRCGNCTYLARWNHRTGEYTDTMDHLACFAPGMLILGAEGTRADADRELAVELMHTCYRMYADSPSGLAPEIAAFGHRTHVVAAEQAKHFLLRPETSESLLILWRLTGDPKYREWGWHIFGAIETHTKVPSGGYVPLKDVTLVPPPQDEVRPLLPSGTCMQVLTTALRPVPPSSPQGGRMESFFTAETLKYLYLLFGDGSEYPLSEYVFNTEAHPLRIHDEYRYGAWGSLPAEDELCMQALTTAPSLPHRYGARWGSLPAEDELAAEAPAVPRPDAATHAAAAAGNRTAEAQLEAADRAADELQDLRGRVELRAALIRQIPTTH